MQAQFFYDPLPVLRICSDFSLPSLLLTKKNQKKEMPPIDSFQDFSARSLLSNRRALSYFDFRKPIKTEVEISGRTYLLVVPDR